MDLHGEPLPLGERPLAALDRGQLAPGADQVVDQGPLARRLPVRVHEHPGGQGGDRRRGDDQVRVPAAVREPDLREDHEGGEQGDQTERGARREGAQARVKSGTAHQAKLGARTTRSAQTATTVPSQAIRRGWRGFR